jgi:hypothetical protein
MEEPISPDIAIELPAFFNEKNRATSAKHLAAMHAAKVNEDLVSHFRFTDHYLTPRFRLYSYFE